MTTNTSGFFSLIRLVNSRPSSDFSGFSFVGVAIKFSLVIDHFSSIFLLTCFIIFSPISIHLPAGLSHCVTTPTTSNLLSCTNASRKGTPIGAEEKNTTR